MVRGVFLFVLVIIFINLAHFRADLMMPYYFHKNPNFGKHSVTIFEVPNAGVHCMDVNDSVCSK